MASTRDLRRRMQSVKNTQQITRAMKMVSAAKLRRSQEAIVNFRPYSRRIGELIELVASVPGQSTDHVLLRAPLPTEGQKPRVLLVLVTSDRGLCGGFNGSLTKLAQAWIRENQAKYSDVQMAFVGKKGVEFFRRRKIVEARFQEFGNKAKFDRARDLTLWILEQFQEGAWHEVHFIYNEFKNAMAQKPTVERYLPVLSGEVPIEGHSGASSEGPNAAVLIVKPSPQAVLEELLKKHFSLQTFRVFLESQASEHGARMTAMESATRNAGEVVKKLTLQYNKQRQAGITKELLEIVSGSEAQKAS